MSLSLRTKYAQFRFRLKARKKHCVGLRVGDVPRFVRRLQQNDIPAVVLRWFNEVPRTPQEERRCTDDVDLLVDGAGLEKAVALAADQPGPVRCDLYTDVGRRGSTYRGMPYYPPVLARQLLEQRVLFDSAFWVPGRQTHVASLMYHLFYHKGSTRGSHRMSPAHQSAS